MLCRDFGLDCSDPSSSDSIIPIINDTTHSGTRHHKRDGHREALATPSAAFYCARCMHARTPARTFLPVRDCYAKGTRSVSQHSARSLWAAPHSATPPLCTIHNSRLCMRPLPAPAGGLTPAAPCHSSIHPRHTPYPRITFTSRSHTRSLDHTHVLTPHPAA
jgi:hypothetical protein